MKDHFKFKGWETNSRGMELYFLQVLSHHLMPLQGKSCFLCSVLIAINAINEIIHQITHINKIWIRCNSLISSLSSLHLNSSSLFNMSLWKTFGSELPIFPSTSLRNTDAILLLYCSVLRMPVHSCAHLSWYSVRMDRASMLMRSINMRLQTPNTINVCTASFAEHVGSILHFLWCSWFEIPFMRIQNEENQITYKMMASSKYLSLWDFWAASILLRNSFSSSLVTSSRNKLSAFLWKDSVMRSFFHSMLTLRHVLKDSKSRWRNIFWCMWGTLILSNLSKAHVSSVSIILNVYNVIWQEREKGKGRSVDKITHLVWWAPNSNFGEGQGPSSTGSLSHLRTMLPKSIS